MPTELILNSAAYYCKWLKTMEKKKTPTCFTNFSKFQKVKEKKVNHKGCYSTRFSPWETLSTSINFLKHQF